MGSIFFYFALNSCFDGLCRLGGAGEGGDGYLPEENYSNIYEKVGGKMLVCQDFGRNGSRFGLVGEEHNGKEGIMPLR